MGEYNFLDVLHETQTYFKKLGERPLIIPSHSRGEVDIYFINQNQVGLVEWDPISVGCLGITYRGCAPKDVAHGLGKRFRDSLGLEFKVEEIELVSSLDFFGGEDARSS